MEGMLLDLSSGGCLFGGAKAATMGAEGLLSARWGSKELKVEVTVVGVRSNTHDEGPRWLHSLKFRGELSKPQEQVLFKWLDELSLNG